MNAGFTVLTKIEPDNRHEHEQRAGKPDGQTALQRIEDLEEVDESQDRNQSGQWRRAKYAQLPTLQQHRKGHQRDQRSDDVDRIG